MKSHPCVRAAAVVIAVLVIAGCSSSGDDATDKVGSDTGAASSGSSTSTVPEGTCPTEEEMEFLASVTAEQDDGPVDQNDIDNVIERARILRAYVPADMLEAFDLYIEDFVAAYRELEGMDLPALIMNERAEDPTYNPPGMSEARAIMMMANDPKYGQVVAFMSQTCPGIVF